MGEEVVGQSWLALDLEQVVLDLIESLGFGLELCCELLGSGVEVEGLLVKGVQSPGEFVESLLDHGLRDLCGYACSC